MGRVYIDSLAFSMHSLYCSSLYTHARTPCLRAHATHADTCSLANGQAPIAATEHCSCEYTLMCPCLIRACHFLVLCFGRNSRNSTPGSRSENLPQSPPSVRRVHLNVLIDYGLVGGPTLVNKHEPPHPELTSLPLQLARPPLRPSARG